MDKPVLVVLAGLPGTGKTTLAKLLVGELGATYLRTDPIAGAILRGQLTSDPAEAGRVAYLVAEEVCAENLEGGAGVVIDGVNALHERRAMWPPLALRAGAPLAMFETVLRDEHEHRRRLEAREPNGGFPWASVVRTPYDPWDAAQYGDRAVIDMTDTAAGLAAALRVLADASSS